MEEGEAEILSWNQEVQSREEKYLGMLPTGWVFSNSPRQMLDMHLLSNEMLLTTY